MIKIFAHRGFAENKLLQNSMESLQKAFELGFRFVEFDIWFFKKRLVLKHDRPKVADNLPEFADYFKYKNKFEYWMDFKNLNEKNVDEALKIVKRDLTKYSIDLDKIYFAPFITDYKKSAKMFTKIRKYFGENVNLVAVCEALDSKKDVQNLREFLTQNNVKFLSIFYKLIDEDFMKKFSDIKIFAWTVNDVKTMQKLEKLGVAAIATDNIIPKIK